MFFLLKRSEECCSRGSNLQFKTVSKQSVLAHKIKLSICANKFVKSSWELLKQWCQTPVLQGHKQGRFLELSLGFKYQATDIDLKHLFKMNKILKTRPVCCPRGLAFETVACQFVPITHLKSTFGIFWKLLGNWRCCGFREYVVKVLKCFFVKPLRQCNVVHQKKKLGNHTIKLLYLL